GRTVQALHGARRPRRRDARGVEATAGTGSRMTDSEHERHGLALVGLRGSGKSTVGRLLARRLGRPFVDADVELEARAGRPIREIFAEQGEPAFRDWEERVLADLMT